MDNGTSWYCLFLVVVNAFNFIDGIDGLAISEAIKIILVFGYFNDNLFSINMILSFVPLIPLYYLTLKRIKNILGDSGSLFLGTLIVIYVLSVLNED